MRYTIQKKRYIIHISRRFTVYGQTKAAAFIKPTLAIDPAGFNECERIHRKALQAWEKDPKADPEWEYRNLTDIQLHSSLQIPNRRRRR